MTKSEFNRTVNFLNEKGDFQDGNIEFTEDPKDKIDRYRRFHRICISKDSFIVYPYHEKNIQFTVHRKYVKSLNLSGMRGWVDIKGQRERKLNRIL
jgi:hypothetical protein